MKNCQKIIGDCDGSVKKEELLENCENGSNEIPTKAPGPNKSLPNGCVKHTLDDNGLVKVIPSSLETDSTVNSAQHEAKEAAEGENSCKEEPSKLEPNTTGSDIGHLCDSTADASPMHTATKSQNQSECDMDSADFDGDLATSSDGATDSVSTAISRVSISDTESSSRTDSESSKPQRPLTYVVYESEEQMPDIMRLITKDLSEPYSIYTYRYFIHNWPKLCFLAMDEEKCVGAIVCKLDLHKKMVRRGYIAMLAVDENYRRRGIGSHLVMKAIRAMVSDDCDEVVLETEITNKAALRLYENLGFVRDKRLFRYYLNGVDALRLKLWLR